jgi:hypothetical protein
MPSFFIEVNHTNEMGAVFALIWWQVIFRVAPGPLHPVCVRSSFPIFEANAVIYRSVVVT